ncbi:3-deoxy-manno-octulosonate cytidylyltransferase [Rhabdothermincola sediminis]|uniref:3-deoxy-manno-octulosonate cytidylyltransferase n=1 Tax=Rhabdothermincola sediminis TaxID=2751370 RepID=UPI001AA032A9|nr:3-deoxy-manno-octulosonate cytidylyltransferase [Rhabdothermincola sediminis]
MGRTVIVIPARYESSRFPGKPLALLDGTSLIQRTWQQCVAALGPDDVYVATDDDRIESHCRDFGAQVVLTPTTCPTGTDRVYAASEQIDAEAFVNVQGDEPLVDPADILAVIAASQAHPGEVVNAMCPIDDESTFRDPNVPKVVSAPDGRLLYMSRAAVPTGKDLGFRGAWRQVCVYAFPTPALKRYANHGGKTPVEQIEDIEILRFLELGIPVRMVAVSSASLAVDVPGDIARVEAELRRRGHR